MQIIYKQAHGTQPSPLTEFKLTTRRKRVCTTYSTKAYFWKKAHKENQNLSRSLLFYITLHNYYKSNSMHHYTINMYYIQHIYTTPEDSSSGGGAISIHSTMLYRVKKGRTYRWFLNAKFWNFTENYFYLFLAYRM